MEFLKNWAITVAGVVVFGTICEVILPNGVFRKYVRLTIGMILVLSLLSPLQKWMHGDVDLGKIELSREAYEQRSDMEKIGQEEVLHLYRTNLNTKMQNVIHAYVGEISVEVQCRVEESNPDTFGTILWVTVLTDRECGSGVKEKIKQGLYENFGVSETIISIQLKGLNE